MSKELKKYKARIFGELYPIVSDEDEAFIIEIIKKVDTLMNDISSKYDSIDTKKVAVLAALRACEELHVLQEVLQNERMQSNRIMTLLTKENIAI
ncbi:cell division protein ZapA [Candidatus Dependentiae bacterium]|nr:cell division protein ZapA [Candidatus Dependentiae bacterium]